MSSQIFILTSVTKTTGKSIYDDGSILRALFTPIGGVLRNLKEKIITYKPDYNETIMLHLEYLILTNYCYTKEIKQ